MRRFHFNLERILSLRKHEEHEVEMRLAGVTSECVSLENQIEEARQRLGSSFGVGHGVGHIDLSQSYARGAYQAYLEGQIERLQRQLREREAEREKLAEEYREAYKQRQVLDRLKERREQEYYAEERNQEGYRLDEIGAANYYYRREGEM